MLSQWDKLIERIYNLDKKLRFEDVSKILISIGYSRNQPKGGSSHFTFRKTHQQPITIPKDNPVKRAYIELVRDAMIKYESEES